MTINVKMTKKQVIDKLSEYPSCALDTRVAHLQGEWPTRQAISKVIALSRAILFPGFFGNRIVERTTLQAHIGVYLSQLEPLLACQIKYAFALNQANKKIPSKVLEEEEITLLVESYMAQLPSLRERLTEDAQAIYENDPAALDTSEVVLCYPSFFAITNYRIAHVLYELNVPYLPRVITEIAHAETGIDIHPGAQIGHAFSMDHGTGVVIGETTRIGNHVRVFQGVSFAGQPSPLGSLCESMRGVDRHPVVEDNVTIYSNVTLLGLIHIGKGSTICGNVWVNTDIPAGSKVKQDNQYDTKTR